MSIRERAFTAFGPIQPTVTFVKELTDDREAFGYAVEGTLAVSGGWLGKSAHPAWLRSEAIERHRVEDAAPGTRGSQLVASCGRLMGDQRVVIVDPETARLR